MKRNLPALFLLLAVLSIGAQSAAAQKRKAPKVAKAAAGPQVSAMTVARVVNALAADDMQGRGTGQPGGLKAARFLASEFQRIGLQPLPGNPGFEQVFPVYETSVSAMSASLNGTVVPAAQLLVFSNQPQLEWTSQTPAVEILTIGPEQKPMEFARRITRPTQNLLVLLDPAHAEAFQTLRNAMRQPRLRTSPAGNAYSSVVLLAPAASQAPKFEVTAKTDQRTVELRNVVGLLPGRDTARTRENVVFSGHYDHLGVVKPVAGDSIANGADDDASGTAAVVALAEYFKQKNDNARPLIFTAFVAEEIGGFGAQHFSRQLDPNQVVAMFNIEMIGKVAKFGPNTAFITGFEKSDFGKLLQASLAGSKFRFEPDPYPEQNLFYRSDNATLAKLGVPAHTISSDQIPDDKLYHTVDDEVASLNLPNMTAIIQAIAQSASGIVAGRQTPTRVAPEAANGR